jgi:flagellum-specific ATP synthase
METLIEKYLGAAERVDPIKCAGSIVKVQGLLIESRGPAAIIGEVCRIDAPKGRGTIRAEVVGLRGEIVQLMAFDETAGIEIGSRVVATGERLSVAVSPKLLGRTLDSLGHPRTGRATSNPPPTIPPWPILPIRSSGAASPSGSPRAFAPIDGLLAVGKGQRLGIFAGSGVGKSTLLGMVARNTNADVNVVALIGERGREVNDFIANDLGEEGMARSVVIVSPSNARLLRVCGALCGHRGGRILRDKAWMSCSSSTRSPASHGLSAR